MPAYDHERFVAESIKSVLAQTYRPLELIVIDDGSSDSTASVIESVADEASCRLDRFVFKRQRNRGLTATMNRALHEARGDFVTALGSDDLLLPRKIERLLALPDWRDPTMAAAFGDACFIDERGDPIGVLADHTPTAVDSPGAETQQLAHLLRAHPSPELAPLGSYASLVGGSYIPSSSTLIRRSALEAVGGYDEHFYADDYPLWLRLAREYKMVPVREVVAAKRVHGKNISLVQRRRIFRDMFELMVRERGYCRSDPVAEFLRKELRDRVLVAVEHHGSTRDLIRVIGRHPFAGPQDLIDARRRRAAQRTSTQ